MCFAPVCGLVPAALATGLCLTAHLAMTGGWTLEEGDPLTACEQAEG
ncbi:MAG: hypothetical protein NC218_08900 [Acetobacter sp.]|nr:hypothetical protein [Acetobacter sp.]